MSKRGTSDTIKRPLKGRKKKPKKKSLMKRRILLEPHGWAKRRLLSRGNTPALNRLTKGAWGGIEDIGSNPRGKRGRPYNCNAADKQTTLPGEDAGRRGVHHTFGE